MNRFLACARLPLTLVITLAGAAAAQTLGGSPSARQQLLPPDLAQVQDHVPGELLVKFRTSAPSVARAACERAVGASVARVFAVNSVAHWRLPAGMPVERALALLGRAPLAQWIEYAEPNYWLFADDVPDDPLLSELWGLHNLGQMGGTEDADIDALEAWQATTGSSSVVVAVIDTGIDYTHPDLAANIWTNPGEIAANGSDDDGNGYVDDVRGWDFVNGDNDPMDDHGHGSHTAGTIGAAGDNGVGICGVAWNVRLMPLKFLSASGSGSTSDAISAIQYAAAKGVRISNNSWGGGPKSNALQSAIQGSGALFVASAGNNSSSTKQYPAGYDAANIVSVAATTVSDGLASYSNFGSAWVDLGAPGDNVLSCLRGGTYGTMSGTSMAAPHVAGVAALLLAQNPGWSATQLKSQLLATTAPLPALAGKCVTGGRLDARRALGAGELPPDTTPPAPVGDLTASAVGAREVTFAFTSPADLIDGGQPGSVFLCDVRYVVGTSFTEADWNTNAVSGATIHPGAPGAPVTVVVDGLTAGLTLTFALKAEDLSGNLSLLSNAVTVATSSSVPGWTVVTPTGGGSAPLYIGHDFDPSGEPALAFGDNASGQIRLARWSGTAWDLETVASGSAGISFAFDPAGNPSLTHGSGKVYFSTRGATGWTTTTLDSKSSGGDVTWLAYNPVTGAPAVAYRSGSTLRYAVRSGTTWNKESADASAAARYSSLAFDAAGNPALAYSDDDDGDGWLDSLWLARKQGGSWTTQRIDGVVRGYGVHAAIAYDPTTDSFVLSHENEPSPHVWRWNGTEWVVDSPPESAQYVFGCGLVVSPDGTIHLAYSIDSEMRVARRSPSGTWTIEPIDAEYAMPFHTRARLTPDGRVSVSYGGDGPRLSTRDEL